MRHPRGVHLNRKHEQRSSVRNLSARVKLGLLERMYLLTHRGNKVSSETRKGRDGAFRLISAAKAKLVPSFKGNSRVWHYFNDLKYVGLNDVRKEASESSTKKINNKHLQRLLLRDPPHDR